MKRTRLLQLVTCVLWLACKTAADETCLAQFGAAQAVVMGVDSKQIESVETSIAALDGAVAACRSAKRSGELEELAKAHAKLAEHRELLQRQIDMIQQRTELSHEEFDELVKRGDAKCPRGQAYLHRKSNQRIRCVGPQPIDMSAPQARSYFAGRRYRVLEGGAPNELRFEYGAELLAFRYGSAEGLEPPRCVLVYPPPDQSWQELTARLTGVSPAKLKPGSPISSGRGPLLIAVEERPDKVLVRIGACDN